MACRWPSSPRPHTVVPLRVSVSWSLLVRQPSDWVRATPVSFYLQRLLTVTCEVQAQDCHMRTGGGDTVPSTAVSRLPESISDCTGSLENGSQKAVLGPVSRHLKCHENFSFNYSLKYGFSKESGQRQDTRRYFFFSRYNKGTASWWPHWTGVGGSRSPRLSSSPQPPPEPRPQTLGPPFLKAQGPCGTESAGLRVVSMAGHGVHEAWGAPRAAVASSGSPPRLWRRPRVPCAPQDPLLRVQEVLNGTEVNLQHLTALVDCRSLHLVRAPAGPGPRSWGGLLRIGTRHWAVGTQPTLASSSLGTGRVLGCCELARAPASRPHPAPAPPSLSLPVPVGLAASLLAGLRTTCRP